jgi:hypothetical protein
MSGRRAREVRRRKAQPFATFMRRTLEATRRALGLRRRDMRRLAVTMSGAGTGVERVAVGRRTVTAKVLPWRVEFDLPGRPVLWRWVSAHTR